MTASLRDTLEDAILDLPHALDPNPSIIEQLACHRDVQPDLRPEKPVFDPFLDRKNGRRLHFHPVKEPTQNRGRIGPRWRAVQLQLISKMVRR